MPLSAVRGGASQAFGLSGPTAHRGLLLPHDSGSSSPRPLKPNHPAHTARLSSYGLDVKI